MEDERPFPGLGAAARGSSRPAVARRAPALRLMTESPPLWIEPEKAGEARLAIDVIPASRKGARLWFFLHGLVSHRRGEKAVHFARRVARRGDAFASLDLTGHGDSEGDLRGLTLTRNLRDLDRGLAFTTARLGSFSTIHLIGSSMGGITALWYSALHPDRIGANLLIAPAFEMAGRLLLSLGRDKAQRWRERGEIHLDLGHADFDLGYDFVMDETRYPMGDLVRRLKTPTLIFHGSEDDSVPHQLSKSFAMRVKRVELVIVQGGDHRLTEYKEELFSEMWSFVERIGPQLDER